MVWFIWSVVYSVNCLLTFFICTSNTSFSISACNNLQFKYYMFSQTEILIISSWNHRSLWLAAHSGLAPSLIDHKGSIIIIEQSQPRNHHNSSFAWMLSLPASHIRQIDRIYISSPSIQPYRSWRICGTAQCVTVPYVRWNHHIQLMCPYCRHTLSIKRDFWFD